MTNDEARTAVTMYIAERYAVITAMHDSLIQLVQELSTFYIQIDNMLDGTSHIPTVYQLIMFAEMLVYKQTIHPNDWTEKNLRVAMSRLIDDKEFKVFMIKFEG